LGFTYWLVSLEFLFFFISKHLSNEIESFFLLLFFFLFFLNCSLDSFLRDIAELEDSLPDWIEVGDVKLINFEKRRAISDLFVDAQGTHRGSLKHQPRPEIHEYLRTVEIFTPQQIFSAAQALYGDEDEDTTEEYQAPSSFNDVDLKELEVSAGNFLFFFSFFLF
jgi:hypothetical protein